MSIRVGFSTYLETLPVGSIQPEYAVPGPARAARAEIINKNKDPLTGGLSLLTSYSESAEPFLLEKAHESTLVPSSLFLHASQA